MKVSDTARNAACATTGGARDARKAFFVAALARASGLQGQRANNGRASAHRWPAGARGVTPQALRCTAGVRHDVQR